MVKEISAADVIEQKAPKPEEGLHICTECKGHFVYPLDWEEENETQWWVVLRCGACGTISDGVFDQDPLDEFDEILDRTHEEIAQDLGRLARANMADWVDLFVGALKANAISPFDFS